MFFCLFPCLWLQSFFYCFHNLYLNIQLQSSNDINQYKEFNPERKILYDMNSFIYDTNDKLVNSEIEYQLYQKLLKELDNK